MYKDYSLINLKTATDKKHKYVATFLNMKTNRKKNVKFGAYGMGDNTIYSKSLKPEEAQERKRLYLIRHSGVGEDWNNPLSRGALSRWILWHLPSLEESIKFYIKKFNI
jgi:hypothetical protein